MATATGNRCREHSLLRLYVSSLPRNLVKAVLEMELKQKFNMEDSPPMSNHSSLAAPINGRSALLLGQSSPRASLLKTFCTEDTALLLSFEPPPPLLHHRLPTPSILRPTPPPGSDPGGEDVPNLNPKMFIQTHFILSVYVFLRGPSTKEIIFH
ncbi:hypothetical protein ATANTOWER_009037 [Ataeniobius toweri]|uniref:Uncharacterized protein n=1 Tax=Ataeniobius toweri TaxID=208326 RepID=A0ABU7BZN1_9TELE|nr:hypothetical protein [Ataeniobius toweri]